MRTTATLCHTCFWVGPTVRDVKTKLEKIRRQTTYCSLPGLSLSTFIKLFKLSWNSEHCTENVAHTLPDVAQSSEPKPKAVRSINNIVIKCYPKAVFRNKMHQNCFHFRLRLHPRLRLESYDPPRTSCSRLEGGTHSSFPFPLYAFGVSMSSPVFQIWWPGSPS